MAASLEHVRVLIVDDNQHMITLVRTLLHGFGMKSQFEARDAAEAFDRVRDDAIDIVIVDFMMDLLDGIDFVRLVRTGEDSPNPYIPIIMLTAYSERSRVMAARDAGVTEFCRKPVTATDLYRKISACIERPRPFVRAASYFGPDRRRHPHNDYQGPERRAPEVVEHDAQTDPPNPQSAS